MAGYRGPNNALRLLIPTAIAGALVGIGVFWMRTREPQMAPGEWYSMLNAMLNGDVSLLHYQLRRGLDPNSRDNPSEAPLMLKALGSPAKEAAPAVRFLLKYGGDPTLEEPTGMPLLNWAASWGAHPDVIRLLVHNGALPNKADREGLTPLMRAVLEGWPDTARGLIQVGVDVNAPISGGRTPLHEAARRNDVQMLEVLLEAGAALDVVDNSGRTPLHIAARECYTQATTMLLEAGAPLNAVAHEEQTPLDYAMVQESCEECIEVLRAHGERTQFVR